MSPAPSPAISPSSRLQSIAQTAIVAKSPFLKINETEAKKQNKIENAIIFQVLDQKTSQKSVF